MATPSLNQTQRMHWAKRKRLATQIATRIIVVACQQGIAIAEHRADGKRKVTIERRGRKMLDADNAWGGCKILIDELKKFGLIVDDNAANLDLEVTQSRLGKGETPHTIITIEDTI